MEMNESGDKKNVRDDNGKWENKMKQFYKRGSISIN